MENLFLALWRNLIEFDLPREDHIKPLCLFPFAEKDLFEWITALKGIHNVEVHLIGDGRNRERVRQQLEGIPATFYGIIPHENLPALLAQMDLGFIFRKPGIDQSIPVCIFEYTSMKIPSLCNNTGIMAEFVQDKGIGYVLNDENDCTATIVQILKQPSELKRFEALHGLAERDFSLRASREKFAELFNPYEKNLPRPKSA